MNSNADTNLAVIYAPSAERFTRERISQMQRASPAVGWIVFACVIVAIALSIAAAMTPSANARAVVICAALVAVAMVVAQSERYAHRDNDLERCIKAMTIWKFARQRSSPLIEIDMPVPPRDGERVIYRESSVRYEERHVGSVSQPQGAIARAIIGDVVFGPAGAIVGAASARTVTTHEYNTVPVDSGELIISNQRVLFLGQRNTLELDAAKILRWAAIPYTPRVIIDYAARLPGESYSVAPLLFPMAMVRRGNNPAFQMPDPPPPLPVDVDDETLAKLEQLKKVGHVKAETENAAQAVQCKYCKMYSRPDGSQRCLNCRAWIGR